MSKRRILLEEMPEILVSILETLDDLTYKINEIYNVTNNTPRQSITIDQASEIISKARSTIYKLVAADAIPYHKKGQRLYFYEDELYQWLASGKHNYIEEEEHEPHGHERFSSRYR